MKKLLTFLLTALLAFSVGWAADLTYTFTSGSSGSLVGAPTGVSASFTSTYNGFNNGGAQLTSGNSLTLTISGFTSSYKLTGIKIAYTTNKSSGRGTVSARLGTLSVATDCIIAYSGSGDGRYTVNESTMAVTETAFNGNNLILTVNATTNSIYVNYFIVTYEDNGSTPTLTVSETDLTLPDIPVNESSTSGQFNVSGSNLTGNVTLTRTSGSSDFSLSTSSIAPSNGSVNQNVTVTYSGTSTTETSATFSISSPGATTQYITVTAKKATGGGGSDSNAFTLVTDASNLEDGEYVLVYSSGTNYALSNTWNSGYYSATSSNFTLSNNVVTLSTGNSVNILTLTKTGNSYYIKDADDYYVGYSSSTNLAHNNTFSSISNSNSYKWNISIATNGNATITNVGTGTRVIRLRESGYDRWAAYSNTNSTGFVDGRLYKRDTNNPRLTVSDDSIDLGTITGGAQSVSGSFTLTGANLTAGVTLSASGDGFSVSPTTIADANGDHTITVTYNGNSATTDTGTITIESDNGEASSVNVTVTAKREQLATPTFSPAPGTYTSAQTVTISSATLGATIAYTYNGGSVQTGTAPVSLYLNTAGTTVIEAYATLAGYVDSDPVTATYTINLTPTLTVSPTIVNINDDNSANGRKGSFTVNGTNIGTANVGVTRTNDKFTPHLETTSGSGSATNASTYWYFTPAGSLNGSVEMTYNGHALSATTAVTLANAEGANHVSAVVNVNYLYTGNIYIMGYVNENGWAANNGELMDRDESTGNYSKTLTLLDSGDGHAYISFTKALANGADDWNSIAGYRFGPESNGNWTFNENLVNVPCALDTTGGYWSIKIPAGEWVVSINPNTNKFTLVPHVPAPVFDPAGGRYETAQDVEITCTNVDAHIYYTTDGSTPSANNGTLYTDPITVSAESTTIKAIAIYGNASSSVTTATYTIKPIGADDFILVESDNDITASDEYVLVCTRTSGANEGDHAMSYNFNTTYYSTTQSNFTRDDIVVTLEENATVNVLTLEDAGEGLFYIKDHDGKYLRYINGSTSNAVYRGDKQNTAEYKWSISINNNKEVVILNSGVTRYLLANPSANRYACYENTSTSAFYPKLYRKGVATVPAPQITPAGGTSNKRFESVEVTITAAEGCRIYYTTDGSAPSVNSTEYTGVFVLPYGSAPTTVKAIAVDGEGKVSRVTTVVYYWDRVQVSISPASKEVVGDVDVTITPSPSDATVTYTINGGEPQTYNGQFTVQVNEENTPVTVEATAVKGESTATASVTYTYKDGGVNSIAEFLALDNNEERFFKNPVVVLFDYSQNGDQDYIWVKDRTGYMKLFIQPGFDEDTSKPRYNNGDVIPEGFTVKKIYYTENSASFIEGKSEDPSLENFKNPTERALADPEQVKLSELLANPAKYNDRYLYINKLEITGHGGVNYYVASDENGDGVSEVFGNTNGIVCYNKFPTWNEKDGTSHTVTIPSADGTYYNVKFIFQKYGSVYEIMPIEFTPWEENKVRLEDLVKIGVKDDSYTITNELVAVKVTWDDNQKKFAIFAKDDEAYANKRYPADGQEEYLIRYETPTFINEVPQKDYDQSNWLEILIPSEITSKQDGLYQNQLATLQERYENKILPGSSVKGTYVDVLNPTIGMASEISGELKDASYDPNIFFTGNFVMENLGENGAVSYNQANDGTYFMMDVKPQEFCMVVWAYYEGSGNYFIAPEPEGAEINGHGFHGSFLADMSLCEDIYGLESAAVNKGTSVASCFKASNDESYGSQQMLYGFKAIVRKNPDYWNAQGGNGAPSRIQPYSEADGNAKEGNPAYKVYPMSVGSTSSGNVTDVNEVNAIKAVVSVRYYNVMGMESEKPFEGINIVVTRYSDGSASTMKVLR